MIKSLISDDWKCLIKFEMEELKRKLNVIVTITSRWWEMQIVVPRELLWSISEQIKEADELLQKEKERGNG